MFYSMFNQQSSQSITNVYILCLISSKLRVWETFLFYCLISSHLEMWEEHFFGGNIRKFLSLRLESSILKSNNFFLLLSVVTPFISRLETTIIHNILETNSCFYVKKRTMGKVQFPFFSSFKLILTKFHFGRKAEH